jgi:hypothetical protein
MNKILDVVEDIKQNITDNQYKIIMDSLMEVHKIENKNVSFKSTIFKCTTLINWLDLKLEIKPRHYERIKKTNLQKYIIKNFYNDKYYENIDFVKKVLDVYFLDIRKKTDSKLYYENVKYINEEEAEEDFDDDA